MMPGFTRRGDWLVDDREFTAAKRETETWSRGRLARDRLSRAPIETDREVWERNSRGMDFPGVDTPRDDPRTSLLDEYHRATDVSRRDYPQDAIFAPEETPEWKGSKRLGGLEETSKLPPETGRRARDAFRL